MKLLQDNRFIGHNQPRSRRYYQKHERTGIMDNKAKNTTAPELSHLDFAMTNTASAMDFTGLIPANPQTDAELEAYKQLYGFGTESNRIIESR
jgi:hypothetical protein